MRPPDPRPRRRLMTKVFASMDGDLVMLQMRVEGPGRLVGDAVEQVGPYDPPILDHTYAEWRVIANTEGEAEV